MPVRSSVRLRSKKRTALEEDPSPISSSDGSFVLQVFQRKGRVDIWFRKHWLPIACHLLLLTSTTAAVSKPPAWQTVFADTNILVPLFGEEGPPWKLNYQDTVWSTDSTQSNYQNLTARVPGDVVSDLMLNGIIQDPYFDFNLWEQQDHWLGPQPASARTNDPFDPCQKEQTRIWIYSTEVELDDTPFSWQLIVESLQMGATLEWNGIFLGNITDQFLRSSLDITPTHLSLGQTLQSGKTKHTLTVSFDPSIETDGRFMACAGGWDWAPYTLACDAKGRRIFTRGIVQPIYLIAVDQAAITHVVPKIYYDEKVSPRNPLNSLHAEADFTVKLEVHLDFVAGNGHGQQYVVVASADFSPIEHTKKILPPSNKKSSSITFTIKAPSDQVELWWPNGMGAQPLYHVNVAIRKQEELTAMSERRFLTDSDHIMISKRIGFRTAGIITINETAEALNIDSLEEEEDNGTGMHGMYLRVNGALVMARGANVIPADQFEGRYSFESQTNDRTYQTLVRSAAAANMNIIRVWGGGKFLPQAFYDACDELGILLYQDQMFVDEAKHGPSVTTTIKHEIQHVVRTLASHPSIVIWNGCNECQVIMGTSNEIYATFVLQTVAEEDDTRSIWPSSPSKYGWKSGATRYDSKPNGKPLATRDPSDHKDAPTLERHGPYQRGFSIAFPGVNGIDQHFPYPSKPNNLNEGGIGPEYPNHFESEFGCSVWSSFESVSAMVRPEHWGLHGGEPPDTCEHSVGNVNVCEGSNVMAQRNYPCDTVIEAYFGNSTSLEDVGESAFQAQLYQCMLGQTLWMKADIERRRSDNSFGVMIWQLNEIWPTGGWGVLEYSSTLPGQMLGGRWKPLMHLLESILFRDVIAACGRSNRCFVRNDGVNAVNATVTLEAWNIAGSRNRCSVDSNTFNATLSGGASSTVRFQAPKEWTSDQYDAILIKVTDTTPETPGSTLMADSVFLWDFPKAIPNLIATKVTVTIDSILPSPDQKRATVSVSSDALALYVVLTTQAPGRFDENAFVLRPQQQKTVSFVSLAEGDEVDLELLKKSIRVEHLSSHFQ